MKYSTLLIGVLFSVLSITHVHGKGLFSLPFTVRKCKKIHQVQEDIQGCLIKMELPKDVKSYCAIACITRELGLMNTDYSLDEHKTISLLQKFPLPIPSNDLENILKVCNKKVIETMKRLINISQNNQYTDAYGCRAAEILMRCFDEMRNQSWEYISCSEESSGGSCEFSSE